MYHLENDTISRSALILLKIIIVFSTFASSRAFTFKSEQNIKIHSIYINGSNRFFKIPNNEFHREKSRLMSSPEPQAWTVPQGIKFGKLDKLKLQHIKFSLETSLSDVDFFETSKSNQVLIATKAVGLNFADIFCVLGLYSAANEIRGNDAFIPGLEFSGVVINDPTGTYQSGDRVLGFTRFGAYSDYVMVDSIFLKPLPEKWTFLEGAGFIVQALTAWHGLVEIGRMPNLSSPNPSSFEKCSKPYIVVIHSAAGGVGLWASEIASRRGAVVIGVVGDEKKASTFYNRVEKFSPLSKAMIRGEESTFASRLAKVIFEVRKSAESEDGSSVREDSQYDLKALAKLDHGADIVMESLGGKYFQASFDSINSGGCLVTFGSTSYVTPGLGLNMIRLVWRFLTRPRVDPGELTSRNIRLAGFNLIYLTNETIELRRQLNNCIACLSGSQSCMGIDGEVLLDNITPPVIGETFDFRTGAIEAMKRLKSGKTVGKVVLDNSDNPCHKLNVNISSQD